jgi:hypothetical protein
MSHIPVNHPLRTFYRVLATLAGLYVLIFGIVAFAKTRNESAFDQHHLAWVLGLRANMGFALISIVAGAIIIVSAVIGRNVDRFINIWGGCFFMAVGMAMLLLMRTNANFLGFSMSNCVVSFLIGTVLLAAGLYGKTGSADEARAEELARHHH